MMKCKGLLFKEAGIIYHFTSKQRVPPAQIMPQAKAQWSYLIVFPWPFSRAQVKTFVSQRFLCFNRSQLRSHYLRECNGGRGGGGGAEAEIVKSGEDEVPKSSARSLEHQLSASA